MKTIKSRFLAWLNDKGKQTLFASHPSESEHLTFKGLPIDGPLNEFVKTIEKTGFTLVARQADYAVLQGAFAGYTDCDLIVSCHSTGDTVNAVGLTFPDQEEWSSLEGNYMNLKAMLAEKYGEPTEVVEEFQGDITPTTDDERLQEVKMNRCYWRTLYSFPTGDIILSIRKDSNTLLYVGLTYADRMNSAAAHSSALEEV